MGVELVAFLAIEHQRRRYRHQAAASIYGGAVSTYLAKSGEQGGFGLPAHVSQWRWRDGVMLVLSKWLMANVIVMLARKQHSR